MRVTIFPSDPAGRVRIPPSKSVCHRAILCAALADPADDSLLQGVGDSQDIAATISAVQALGARFQADGDGLRVRGIGDLTAGVCTPDPSPLHIHCNESGSTLRFLIPLLSLTGREVCLTGEGRLLERPQQVYETLFQERGLRFEHTAREIRLHGALPPGNYSLRGDVSSQFITGLLLALPLLDGDSTLTILPPAESFSYVAMTLAVLRQFGIEIRQSGLTFTIPGRQTYRPGHFTVEGDYSQLAFFAVLGALRGQVECMGISPQSAQGDRVILPLLRTFGADVRVQSGGVSVVSGPPLSSCSVDLSDCPDLGPVLMVLAARAQGTAVFSGAARLRLKESDRIASMESGLRACGIEVRSSRDTVWITGAPDLLLPACQIDCCNDHRIAMSFAVLAAASRGGPVTLLGAECVRKSYPGFFDDLASLGVRIECRDEH